MDFNDDFIYSFIQIINGNPIFKICLVTCLFFSIFNFIFNISLKLFKFIPGEKDNSNDIKENKYNECIIDDDKFNYGFFRKDD